MAKKSQVQEAKQEVIVVSTLLAKAKALEANLNLALYERVPEVKAIAAAVFSANHVFVLGPKGAAKSMLIEAFANAVKDARYFELLCSKAMPPEEFFGPINVPALLEGRFERNVEDYLPDADIASLDEVFKCNAAALNGTLGILNERRYKNGKKKLKCPLISVLGASNELAQEDDLGPLYDRFLVRLNVTYLQEVANVVKLLTVPSPPVQQVMTVTELRAINAEVAAVRLPDAVAQKAAELRETVLANAMTCSDRRLKQAMGLVRAMAWLDGRKEANVGDLAVLAHVFWETPNQIPKAYDIVMDAVNPLARKGRDILRAIRSVVQEVEKAKPGEQMNVASDGIPKINEAVGELGRIIKDSKAAGHNTAELESALAKAKGESRALVEKYIGKHMAHINEED